jgi:hypothetical protein
LAPLEDLEMIDMLFVDGPPGMLQRHSRYPAVPQLLSRLSPSAVVLLDDAGRSDEREIMETWSRDFGLRLVRRAAQDRLAILSLSPEGHHADAS